MTRAAQEIVERLAHEAAKHYQIPWHVQKETAASIAQTFAPVAGLIEAAQKLCDRMKEVDIGTASPQYKALRAALKALLQGGASMTGEAQEPTGLMCAQAYYETGQKHGWKQAPGKESEDWWAAFAKRISELLRDAAGHSNKGEK